MIQPPALLTTGTLVLALLLAWSDLRAGDLAGKVRMAGGEAPAANRLQYPGQVQGHEAVDAGIERRPVQDVVVYLEGAREGHGSPPLPVLEQRGKQFVPRALPVRVGTAVEFPNRDPFYHNVFSYSKTQSFDLGRFPRGDSRRITFDQPGLIKVFCEIHSQMKGYVLVLETPAFTVPDAGGTFEIHGIPEGSYRAVFWHPSASPRVIDVTIGPGRTWLDVDL